MKNDKKTRELAALVDKLSSIFEIEGWRAKLIYLTGAHFFIYKVTMMQKLTDRCRVFKKHIENKLTDTTKQTKKAITTGKYNELADMTAVLQSAFFCLCTDPANIWVKRRQKWYLYFQHRNCRYCTMQKNLKGTKVESNTEPSDGFESGTLGLDW